MGLLSATERVSSWFHAHLTRSRLNFFFAGFLVAQVGLFLYQESGPGVLDRNGRVKGRDFLHFYLSGLLVCRGEADRLFDQDYFFATQLCFVELSDFVPRYPSVYPPTSALLFAPLGVLGYEQAVVLWWGIQLLCFVAAGVLLYRELRPGPGWGWTAVIGFAAFYPVLNTFWNGQLAALLLLVWVAGLWCRRVGRPVWAGLLLSLLALKPQLMVAVGLWLLLRPDGKVLLGVMLGGVVQVAVVLVTFGPGIFVAYLETAGLIVQWYRFQTMSVDHQHALTGILTTLFGADSRNAALGVQFAATLLAGWWMLRVSRREPRLEIPAAVSFALVAVPHLLTHDLVYLLIPVAGLLMLSRARPSYVVPAVLLYAAATLSPLYAFLGFSLLPASLLIVLFLLDGISTASAPGDVGPRGPGGEEERPRWRPGAFAEGG